MVVELDALDAYEASETAETSDPMLTALAVLAARESEGSCGCELVRVRPRAISSPKVEGRPEYIISTLSRSVSSSLTSDTDASSTGATRSSRACRASSGACAATTLLLWLAPQLPLLPPHWLPLLLALLLVFLLALLLPALLAPSSPTFRSKISDPVLAPGPAPGRISPEASSYISKLSSSKSILKTKPVCHCVSNLALPMPSACTTSGLCWLCRWEKRPLSSPVPC